MVDEHCVVISEVLTQFLSRITVSLYFCPQIQHSLFPPHRIDGQIVPQQLWIKPLRALFIVNDSFFLTQELKGSFSASPTQVTTPPLPFSAILGDPGADSGDEGKSKRAEKYGTKKSKERREEPLETRSYQTSSKRSPQFWLLIGARKLLCFSAQSEGRTAATVWK